ncbi:MAG: hypothetical protein KGD57_03265 [Candidatus Lokiarchaeota archaeon]|nr:hypothetical protein [Candidatus Lokiarchaeota archaeon]
MKLNSNKANISKPKEFKTKKSVLPSKLKGKVKIKNTTHELKIEGDKIELKKGEYVKLLGITSVNRTPLFCSNDNFSYLLELTNNLDFIATSILGGDLDKMLLVSQETNIKENCQFYEKDGIIYLVYGEFPDKKGKWLLEQMAKYYTELIEDRNVDKLDKLEKHEINIKFKRIINFILQEYYKLQDVFSDQEIPYVEDKLRVDYLGLSSKSIGVISLLIGDELTIDVSGQFDDPLELKDMKESLLTAKIEAIAANTLGNTGSVPRWIAVKLGFQNYRFLTFQKYKNDYFISLLCDGNLEKLTVIENKLEPLILKVTVSEFTGDLKRFNKLKPILENIFDKNRYFS